MASWVALAMRRGCRYTRRVATGRPLDLDGDLFVGPSAPPGQTEIAARILGATHGMDERMNASSVAGPMAISQNDGLLDTVDGPPAIDELNGNWDDIRDRLAEQVREGFDTSIVMRSIDANSRAAQLAMFGGVVQFDDPDINRGTVSLPTRGGSVARAFWWGFHVQVSQEDVQTLVASTSA